MDAVTLLKYNLNSSKQILLATRITDVQLNSPNHPHLKNNVKTDNNFREQNKALRTSIIISNLWTKT